MDPLYLIAAGSAAVMALLALGVPIAFGLGTVACLGLITVFAWPPGAAFSLAAGLTPGLSLIEATALGFVHSYHLSMVPLFIALGHVAHHSGITTDLFRALRLWLARVPGGLAMASVVGCGGFSAVTGSSVACAAAMARITVPEMLRHRYSPRLATGAVAAGGTLGSLIPPSLLFVIYAIFADQSVTALFLAGLLPGLLSLLGYLLTIAVWVRRRPADAPAPPVPEIDPAARWRALAGVWPVVLLFALVVGGIAGGLFTPTEAAAVSLVVAVLIGLGRRRLTMTGLREAAGRTIVQTSALFLIALAAKLFTVFVSLSRLTPRAVEWLQAADVSVAVVLLGCVGLYLVLGMVLDSIGILVLTLPVTVPLVTAFGVDAVWFGVVVVKLLEIGLITPPIGLNVFVLHGVAPAPVGLGTIFRGVAWFLVSDAVVVALLLLLPALALALPQALG